MFSGLIYQLGNLVTCAEDPQRLGRTMGIQVADPLFWSDVGIGDSIAIMGCCLTVVAIENQTGYFELSSETLRCTIFSELTMNAPVHMEKSLRLSDRLQGHLVLGHVDAVGRVHRVEPEGQSLQMTFEAPQGLLKYIAPKGTIAINGVSLTVNGVEGPFFRVNLIPHTLGKTGLGSLKVGAGVNLEVDLLARYLERLMGER